MSYHLARKDYGKRELLEKNCPSSPVVLLHEWLSEAHTDSDDANAMTLSTVDAEGRPSGRIVLLRELTELGISFYTNYNSKKGRDMASNSAVALNFFWPWMERQVRVEGSVEKLSKEVSDIYFASRPRQSQLGALASAQSSVLDSRASLEQRVTELTKEFDGKEIPRPSNWGGYIVKPALFEFWQGRPSRLHDRITYKKEGESWTLSRLSP